MNPTGILIVTFLECILTADNLIDTQVTNNVVRIKEGGNLVLRDRVEADEFHTTSWIGPGNRRIGDFDHQAKITEEQYQQQLDIRNIDRYRSGVYTLKVVDALDTTTVNWSVIVQVVPEQNMSMDTVPACNVNAQQPEISCPTEHTGQVIWEYFGCNVTIRNADQQEIVNEFDQCEEFSKLDSEEKGRHLIVAAREGNIKQVSKLLLLGTPVNYYSPRYDESPLCAACRAGHIELINLLLNAGANASNSSRPNIEYFLKYEDLFSRVRMLLPIHCAALSGSVLAVKTLLSRGVGLNSKDGADRTPFLFAALSGSVPLVEAFLSWGEDPNYKDLDGNTPIYYAACSGSLPLVQTLINKGANPLVSGYRGFTPLFCAANSGSLPTVKFLVSIGYSPSEMTDNGGTPIFFAVHSGSVPVTEYFLEQGISASSHIKGGTSLLHYAALFNHPSVVKKLISAGANLVATDDGGSTPLHLAALTGSLPIAQALVSAGANPLLVSRSGETPLDVAKRNGHSELVAWLSSLAA